jgi:hypothetical protein
MTIFILMVISVNLVLGFVAVDWFEPELRAWGVLPEAAEKPVAKAKSKSSASQAAPEKPKDEVTHAPEATKPEEEQDSLAEYRRKLATQQEVPAVVATEKEVEAVPSPATHSAPLSENDSSDKRLAQTTAVDEEEEAFPEELHSSALNENALDEIRAAWSEPSQTDDEPA